MVDKSTIQSFLSASDKLTSSTKEAYQNDLEQFFVFCQAKKINLKSASLKQVRDFVGHLRSLDYSSRSLARKVSAVRKFYQFLMRDGIIDKNPVELLHISLGIESGPKHLTTSEVVALLSAPKENTSKEIRDRALLELWYATGAKISEMAELTVRSFDWENDTVLFVNAKGIERKVPMSVTAKEFSLKYLGIRSANSPYFFVGIQGQRLSRQSIWKMVKKYAHRAGITKPVTPYMIRHSFAQHLLRSGADLESVQTMLGHRYISTTQRYVEKTPQNVKILQMKFHPRT